MLFFVPPERRAALRLRLKKLLCVPFAFSNKGSHVAVYEPEEQYDRWLATERDLIYAQNPVVIRPSVGGALPGAVATATGPSVNQETCVDVPGSAREDQE